MIACELDCLCLRVCLLVYVYNRLRACLIVWLVVLVCALVCLCVGVWLLCACFFVVSVIACGFACLFACLLVRMIACLLYLCM